jgi:nucleoside-diphosphate kinase
MAQERTLAIIKPDAVEKDQMSRICRTYREAGLQIAGQKKMVLTMDQAAALYQDHVGKHFFAGLKLAMSGHPIVALELVGENAIKVVRDTNEKIRKDLPSAGGPFNVVHGSDSPESAERELKLIFKKINA